MSSKKENKRNYLNPIPPSPSVCGYGRGYLIGEGTYDGLIGSLFTIMESAGLCQKQEDALKSLIKQAVANKVFTYAVGIESCLVSRIYKAEGEKNIDTGIKSSFIKWSDLIKQ